VLRNIVDHAPGPRFRDPTPRLRRLGHPQVLWRLRREYRFDVAGDYDGKQARQATAARPKERSPKPCPRQVENHPIPSGVTVTINGSDMEVKGRKVRCGRRPTGISAGKRMASLTAERLGDRACGVSPARREPWPITRLSV